MIRIKRKFQIACTLLLGALAVPSNGQITINVGDHQLQPNTPNQQIEISVSGSVAVNGLNFKVQVADGFPEAEGSSINGPNITGVDIVGTLNPTIFSGNNTGQINAGSGEQAAFHTTTTSSGNVSTLGRLATIVIDTTGFTSGTFALNLQNVLQGTSPTTFVNPVTGDPMGANITDGTITVVPEPSTVGVFAALFALGSARWLRRKRESASGRTI